MRHAFWQGLGFVAGITVAVLAGILFITLGGVSLFSLVSWWSAPSPISTSPHTEPHASSVPRHEVPASVHTLPPLPDLATYQRELADAEAQRQEALTFPEERLAMAEVRRQFAQPPMPWVLWSAATTGTWTLERSDLPRGRFATFSACQRALHRYADVHVTELRRMAAVQKSLRLVIIDREHYVGIRKWYGTIPAPREESLCYLALEASP